jgi:hypothetical protein
MIAAIFSVATFAQEKKMTELKTDQLPKETTKWVTQNAPGGTIVRAGKIEENNVVTYVAVVETKGQKHGYQFDKDGKFLGKFQAPPATKAKGPKTAPPAPKK